jgi:hypothetical protein
LQERLDQQKKERAAKGQEYNKDYKPQRSKVRSCSCVCLCITAQQTPQDVLCCVGHALAVQRLLAKPSGLVYCMKEQRAPVRILLSPFRALQFAFCLQDEAKERRKAILSSIGEDLLLAANDQPFRFPATFTFVVRSFTVLDGIGKSLDPRCVRCAGCAA